MVQASCHEAVFFGVNDPSGFLTSFVDEGDGNFLMRCVRSFAIVVVMFVGFSFVGDFFVR